MIRRKIEFIGIKSKHAMDTRESEERKIILLIFEYYYEYYFKDFKINLKKRNAPDYCK